MDRKRIAMKNRYVITKNGKPYRAYAQFEMALLVKSLCEDLKPSCEWGLRMEGRRY